MRRNINISVVEAAERRVLQAFNRNKYVNLNFSGGKDSIVTGDIVIKTMQKYNISFDRLYVIFYDEEGVFDDFEQTVIEWREKFISLGAHFYWFCLPIVHYNCVNKLENDETFVCWEPGKEHLWIRKMPKFAIRHHSKFKPGMNYQKFNDVLFKNTPTIVGLRMYESLQRMGVIRRMSNTQNNFIYPIYDWQDNDVWLYIQRRGLKFPITYLYLYKVGTPLNRLRISQFFSIDTIKVVPKILEFYPDLYERIIRREPNADLVMLYWETEMFRSSKQDNKFSKDEPKSWKKKFNEELKKAYKNPSMYPGIKALKVLFKDLTELNSDKVYRGMYGVLIAGDPKKRTVRSLQSQIKIENKQSYETGTKKIKSSS